MIWFWTIATVVAAILTMAFHVAPSWIPLTLILTSLVLVLYQVSKTFISKRVWVMLQKHQTLVFFIALLAIINIFGRVFETVWDTSAGQQFSLRDESRELFEKLERDITLIVFGKTKGKTAPYLAFLTKQLEDASQYIHVEIKDINRHLALAKKYGISVMGEAVILRDSTWVKIPQFLESEIIPGLVRLLEKSTVKLCSVEGHGESSIFDIEGQGLSQAKTLLDRFGYELHPVVLMDLANFDQLQKICTLLIFAGSAKALHPAEISLLNKAVEAKIPMLLTVDPDQPSNGISSWLEGLGLRMSDEYVVDLDNLKKGVIITDLFIRGLRPHLITKDLKNPLFLPKSGALKFEDKAPVQWAPIVSTPLLSRFRLSDETENRVQEELHLMAIGEFAGKVPGMVVLASRTPFINDTIVYGANESLLLGSIAWLSRDEHKRIGALFFEESYMELAPSELAAFRWTFLFFLPGILLLFLFLLLNRQRMPWRK